MQKTYAGWNCLRICIKNASFKLPLVCFSCFNSLFASHFFKNVVPASAGSTILQSDFMQFLLKITLFWPLNGLDNSFFCHLICSFWSFGRSDRYFFAPCPPKSLPKPPRIAFLSPRWPKVRPKSSHRSPKSPSDVKINTKVTPKWSKSEYRSSSWYQKIIKINGKMCISVKHAVHS